MDKSPSSINKTHFRHSYESISCSPSFFLSPPLLLLIYIYMHVHVYVYVYVYVYGRDDDAFCIQVFIYLNHLLLLSSGLLFLFLVCCEVWAPCDPGQVSVCSDICLSSARTLATDIPCSIPGK